MSERPNIVFLFSDQHTRKITGCYGDSVVHTPNLDRLAATGVTFDNAYTASPLCVPARMALLTGRHPYAQRCWTNSDALASDAPTFAHALGRAGYEVTLIGRLHAIGPDQLHGYSRREVGDHSTNWIGGTAHSLGVLDKTNEPFRVSVERAGAGQSAYQLKDRDVTASALDYLEELAARRKQGEDKPFAMTVGLMLPHQPYVARDQDFARYAGKVDTPTYSPSDVIHEHPYVRDWRAFTGTDEVAPEEMARARAAYYGLVTEVDEYIGRILDALEAHGLHENTLIIYTSDHGDQLGERGLWWKQTFYEESAGIPMIMSHPTLLPHGERRSQVVNLIDLAPTMISVAGADPLPFGQSRSLWSVARDGATPWLDETYAEYCTDGMARWTLPDPVRQRMVRSGPWKLVYYDGERPQLFNLAADPGELDDLAEKPAYADIREQLVAKVLATWSPPEIAEQMARRRTEKEYLGAWARETNPAESYRWDFKMEDNWLAPA